MPPDPKPWFTDYFEVRAGVIRLAGSPNLSWMNIADESLSGDDSLLELSRRRGVGLDKIQACLALHAWTLKNPTADPLTLFAPAKPEGGGEQASEFARAVANLVKCWREGHVPKIKDDRDAMQELTSAFVDAHQDLDFNSLVHVAATCQQMVEDLELTPDA